MPYLTYRLSYLKPWKLYFIYRIPILLFYSLLCVCVCVLYSSNQPCSWRVAQSQYHVIGLRGQGYKYHAP